MMDVRQLYIDLIKKTLIDWYNVEKPDYTPIWNDKSIGIIKLAKQLGLGEVEVCGKETRSIEERALGKDMPHRGLSMLGFKRLENIEYCFNEIIKHNIEGDLIETGVWRGGATIFMKALLASINDTTRNVWVADSFEGLPTPSADYEADKDSLYHTYRYLAVPLEEVKYHFEKLNLLDDRVRFLKGWFRDTLPQAPIEKLALLRLDGDMYESTMDALVNLYPKLSVGGYILIDDYHSIEMCKKAVHDYRTVHGISDEIITVDWTGVYWKKTTESVSNT